MGLARRRFDLLREVVPHVHRAKKSALRLLYAADTRDKLRDKPDTTSVNLVVGRAGSAHAATEHATSSVALRKGRHGVQ